MALSAFTKNTQENVYRAGGCFVSDDSGVNYYDLGQIVGGQFKVTGTPVLAEKDSAGRPKQLGMDVSLQFTLEQTADVQLALLDELSDPASNGLWFKFTTIHTNAAGAGAAAGYVFKNVLPNVGADLDFGGGNSMIPITAEGRVSMLAFVLLGSGQTLTFDG